MDIGVVGVENGYIKLIKLLSNRAREPVRIFYWETKHMTVKKKQKNLVLKESVDLPRNIKLLLSVHTWSGNSGLTVDELFPDSLHLSDTLPATFWRESGFSRS